LSRYLFSRSHFRSRDKTVKFNAFMPPPDLKLSVFRTSSLSESQIWSIGTGIAHQQKPPRTLYGRADIQVCQVMQCGLKVDPDNNPPRHASIIGWPREKSKQKLIAMKLASLAVLKLLGH